MVHITAKGLVRFSVFSAILFGAMYGFQRALNLDVWLPLTPFVLVRRGCLLFVGGPT